MAWSNGIWAWLTGHRRPRRAAPLCMEADLQLVRLEERRVLQGMPVAAPAAASGSGSSGHASATYLIARHGNEVDVSLNGVLVKEQSIDQGRLTISALTTGAQFIVDMSGGNPIPKGGLTLIGAQAGTGVQNSLVIQPGNPLTPFATVTYSLLSGDQGSITLTGTSSSGPAQTSTINFSNITSIEDDTAADSRVLELDRGPEQLTLAAAPSIGSQPALVLSSSLGPSVTFVDPATSLSIEAAGQPADSLQLASFDLVASLAVEMAGAVTLSGPVQTGGLSISADTIQVNSNVVAGPSAQFVAQTEIDVAQSASLAALASIDLEAPSIQQVGNLRLLGPGLVRLDGGTGGTVIVSGRIDAADLGPSGNGGNVQVLGNLIALTGQAVVDVSGSNPGSVVIGGNEHDPSLGPLASRTFIGPQALIMADGIGNASGGSVVVWSSQLTVFEGDIEARGGTTGGNGGFAEVSSTGSIDFQGQTDLSASQGQGGNLLLDPTSIILTDRQSNFTPFTPPDFTETLLADVGATFLDVTAGGSFSNVSAGATITLQSTTTISVETALNLFQATGQNNVSLVLQAEGAIIIDQAITADGTGTITIQANDIVPLLGDVLIGAPITANAAISISGDNVIINDQVNSGSGTLSIDANGGTVTTGLGGVLTSTNTSATAITIQDASTVALGNIMDTGGLVLGVGSNVGSVSQNISDTIQANSITASTSGDVILGNSGNVIDSLGVMSVGGALDVQDAIADRTARFTISGAITADSATIGNTLGSITDDASITTNLPLGINLTAIGITQSSSSTLSSGAGPIALVAGTGAVTLAGDLTTTGGEISVSGTRITQNDGTLDSGSGAISLDSGGSIMDLSHGVLTSSSTSDTAISLADASSITLGSVVVTSGGLVLGVSANVGSVTANSTIQANSVTASTSGAVNLQSVNNEIDSLGAMDVGGSLQVNDAVQDVAAMFTITGAIGASSVTIQNTQGSITVNQGITTTAGSIGLAAIGINQNSTLDTSAGTGEIALDGTTGAINLAGNMNTASGRISVNGAGITQSAGTDLDAGSGTITLNADDDAMTLAGTLTTTNTSTTAVTIDHVTTLQLGAVTASFGTLSLTATSNITAGGLLNVAVLTGTGGGTMSFLNRNNEIAAVSMLTSDGTLTLKDNVALNVNGTVTDDLDGSEVSIEVLSAALTLAGDIETTSGNGIQIQLEGVGITQSSGALDSGSGNGSITLNGGAGAVSLAGFMTTTDGVAGAPGGDISVTGAGITQSAGTLYSGLGTITLDGTAAAISLSGTLTSTNGSNAVTIQDATTLQLGTVNAGGGTVSLTTTGAITQVGALDAHVLGGNSGGSVQLDNSNNQVTTLSNFERGGDFTLDDTIALNVNGVLTQGNTANNVSITVVGAGLTLANSITISGSDANGNPTSISLSGNAITQSAGTINAGTGTITLNGGTGAVNLSGTLSSTNSTSGVDAITIDGATIASGGTISAASGTVALDATGTSNPITQTGGHITAGILTVDSAGSIQINGGSNQIASLGAVKHGGDLTLDDDRALEVDGPITEVTNSSNVTIDAVGTLTLAGGITSTGNHVNLTGAGITQTAGIVDAGAGLLTLNGGTGAMSLSGTLTSSNTGNAITLEAVTIASSGTISAAGGQLSLTATGTGSFITQSSGGMAAKTLTIDSAGSVLLEGSTNQIATLDSVEHGGDFVLDNASALEVDGPITEITNSSSVTIDVTGASLTLAGNITSTGTGVSLGGDGLTLSSGTVNAGSGALTLSGGSGGITQSGTVLVANSLAASSTGGAIQLGSSNNQIAVLDTVSRGGDFTLEDKVALEVDGPITGGTIANNVSITVLNFGLTLAGDISSTGGTNGINLTAAAISQSAGTVSAGLGTLTLDAVSGAITQTAGGLAGNTLTATSGGAILLGSNTNQIAFLGSISRGGDFTLEDNAALEVDGPINLGDTSSSVSIDVLNFGLTLAGNIVTVGATNGISLTGVGITQSSGSVAAALGTLTLDAGSGGVTQNGGQLAANSLTASSGGAIQIDGNDNQIAVLGAISRGGDFTLVDNLALEVNGPITAGTAASNVSITDAFFGLTLFGDITTTGSTNGINLTAVGITQSSGTLDAGLGTLTLDSGADSITQSTGMIEANTLVANSGGAIELTNTANQISVLSSISLDGDFTLVNDVVLQVNGPIAPGNNNGTVSITVNGAALTLAGDITAGTNGNDINLTAVGITQAAAGALNSGTGTITLDGGAGAVGLAGGMTAGGDIKVTGAGITQSAGTLDTSSGTGSITLDGTGAISLAGGMRTDSGDLGVTGVGITQTAASTLVSTSGLITVDGGTGAVGMAGGMTTSGNIKVTGAAITQSAGTLDTSSGTGSITLDGTGAIGLAGRMLTSSGEIGVTGVGITQSPVSTLDAGSGAITLDAGGGAISMEGGLNSTNTTTSVTIHDATSVGLGTITASGAVILGVGQDITGAVTQFGSISTPDLVLSGTNSFTLTSAQNSIAALAGTTGSTSVTDSTGISLAGLADQGNLTLQTAGPISQTAAISVTGTSSFSAGANAINLATANDLVGAVSLNNSGAADVTLDNAVGLVLGTSSVGSGNLELTAGGSISQTGTITQAAGAVSTRFVVTTPSADVLLGMANDLSGPITVAPSGSGSVRDLNLQSTDANTRLVSIPISLADLTLTFDNAPVALPTLNLSGSLQVLGGGIVSESGSLSVVGTTQLTTGAFNIDLTSANRLVGAVSVTNTGTGSVTLENRTALTLGNVSVGSGTLSVTALGIKQTGAIVQAPSAAGATFNAQTGTIVLTNLGNEFTGPVRLLNSGANAVSVNDSQALNLAASSVGSGSLTVTADGITESGPIVQAAVAGAATFNAGNANLTLDQSGNTLTGLVTLKNSGTAAITLVNATSLNVSQATAGSGGVNLQAAGALTLGQALGVGNAISTGGAVDLATTTGDVTLQQSIQSTAGGVTVNSGGAINMAAGTLVDAGSDPLSLAATGSIFVAALQTTSAAFTAVNLSSQTGQVAASGHASTNITSAGGLNISADNGIGSGDPLQVSVGSITVQNAQIGDIDIASLQPATLLSALQDVGGNIVITSAGTMTVGLPGLTTAPAAVSTAGSGGITLSADGTAAALVLDQGVSGAGSAVNLTADGAVILAGAVPVTSTAGDINLTAAGSSITMASSSLLQSSSGAIALNAASGVLVSSITTGSTVSVTSATQSIAVVVGLPNSVNITAGGAALSAATGIGTVTAPIVTSVGTLAASNSTRNDIQAVNVGTGLLTIGTVGTTQGIQLSGGVPATINVSTAGPMQVTGNVLNTTGGNIMLTSGGTGSLTTVGRVVTSGGNGSITLSTAGNLNIEDAVNQGIAPAFWTPDIQVSGSGQIIGNAAGQVAIGSNVLVQSGTGSVTEAPPAIGTIVIPQINSDGIATITAPVGRPGDTDLTVTIDWHDGSTTTLLDVAGGAITAAHHYLVNPNLANGAAPIPMTVTVSGDPNISFAGKTIATATATISGTGLFLAYQGLTVPVQAPIIIIVRIEERPAQVVEVVSVDGWIEVVQPRPKQAPGEERVVTMNLVPPGGGAPVPFQLPENVTDDLPALFKRLPDGHYQIFVDEPGRQPRMLIDVYLRQGRPVDPDDKFEGTEDRPPTAMFEAAPTRILISQALPAAKIENRDATAAEFADRALAASLQSPAPAAAIASRGRRVAVHDRHAESAGRWSSSAATVGVAALAGLVVLRPAGNQHTEDERAQLADRTLGHLNGQRLDRAARWSRRVRQHLPLWMPFARSDNRSQEPA